MKNWNKKYLMVFGIAIIVIILIVLIVQINSTNKLKDQDNNEVNVQLSPEEELKNNIKNAEKEYSQHEEYQCYKDENYKIRFYYNSKNLQYASELATSGKLPLKDINSSCQFLYNSKPKTYTDNNEVVQNYINGLVNQGKIVTENKDVKISKITPVEARYIKSEINGVIVENYLIFTEYGVCTFSYAHLNGVECQFIQEILNSIIIQ